MPPESSAFSKSKTRARSELHAPWWHTAILVLWIIGANAIGLVVFRDHVGIASSPSSGSKILLQYVPAIAVQWTLFAYAVFFARPRGVLAHLMGRKWSARPELADVVAAIGLVALIAGSEAISARFLATHQNPAVVALLPRTIGERVTWILFAMSAGFCEEVVYRGYLRTELTVLARSAWLGIALQAVLFGFAHAEQGIFAMIRFAMYGVLFAVVAVRRGNLLPCIAAHAFVDLCAGFAAR